MAVKGNRSGGLGFCLLKVRSFFCMYALEDEAVASCKKSRFSLFRFPRITSAQNGRSPAGGLMRMRIYIYIYMGGASPIDTVSTCDSGSEVLKGLGTFGRRRSYACEKIHIIAEYFSRHIDERKSATLQESHAYPHIRMRYI